MSDTKTKTVDDYIDTEKIKTPELPWQSSAIDKLAGALAKAQNEMAMVGKDSTNPFFNSGYATLSAVLGYIAEELTVTCCAGPTLVIAPPSAAVPSCE